MFVRPWLVPALLLCSRAALAEPEVCVVRGGTEPPVSLEAVRDALALRLGDRPVTVCDRIPPGACAVILESATPGMLALGVSCGHGEWLRDHVPAAPREEVARRVAVEAAALIHAALAIAPPEPIVEPARPPEPVAAVTAAPPPPLPLPRVALQLRAGTSIAPELSGATFALVVDARWFVWQRFHVTAGAKLTGRVSITYQAPERTSSVADRVLWLGAGYRAELARRLFVDAVVAAQYTVPIFESTDRAPYEESTVSRLALRGVASAGYRVHPSLAVVVGAAASMTVVERDILVANGDDALDLGFTIIDLTAGLEVAF